MSSSELEPTAIGTYDQWSLIAGANKWEACQRPNDDSTTRINGLAAGNRQSFVMEDLPPAAGVISSMSIYHRAWGNTSVKWRSFTRLSGANDDYTERNMPGSWASYNDNPTGLSSVPDVNACEVGVYMTLTPTGAGNITTLELDVTWISAANDFVFILDILPPIFGALATLTAREWVAVRSALASRRWVRRGFGPTRLTDVEFERFQRECCEYRFPIHFLPS